MTERTKMPVLNADLRATSFDEVALGFTEEQALKEANRCLHCKNPMCKSGCPVQIDIPEFIAQIKQKNYEKAYEIIYSSNRLPSITGRVCPQETQCEKKCVLGIKGEPVAIGSLERFVADYHRKNTGENGEINGQNQKTFNGCHVEHDFDDSFMLPSEKTKIAVIGSGPCGLTAAGELLSMGYSVTVFEALHKGGGVLSYGIPSFRLIKLRKRFNKSACAACCHAGKSRTVRNSPSAKNKRAYSAYNFRLPKRQRHYYAYIYARRSNYLRTCLFKAGRFCPRRIRSARQPDCGFGRKPRRCNRRRRG